MEFPYFYSWKNNEKRAGLYGRRFRVLVRAGRNSALVEFEGGQLEIISRNAIRKAKPQDIVAKVAAGSCQNHNI